MYKSKRPRKCADIRQQLNYLLEYAAAMSMEIEKAFDNIRKKEEDDNRLPIGAIISVKGVAIPNAGMKYGTWDVDKEYDDSVTYVRTR
ncbi:MAG: hypothetical protein E7265_06630 [Lachnospiraceae bacterium]|nr:hypothetical protein [Lachnospiraceae bacterium]